MSSPPPARRPVRAGSGTSPCPASTRPSPGEASPGRRQARRGTDAGGGRTPVLGPSLGARRLADSVPPTPLGFGGPAPCELSLTPPTRSERDPRKTRFSTRAGSSVVTGSNQRRGAFSPRRRAPRCKTTRPRRPRGFRCSSSRTSAVQPGSPRSNAPPCSGGARSFLLLRPQLLFSSLFLSYPFSLNLCGTRGQQALGWGGRKRARTGPSGSEQPRCPHALAHGGPEACFSACAGALPRCPELPRTRRRRPLRVCSLTAAPLAFYSFP